MTRRRRRRRGRRIQCCIKDNNTLYQNEISTLRRLMLADIHDTPCKTLCRVYSNTMSAPKFYGTERSAPTIPYFLRPNIVFKIRAIIRRVLSLRALLLRKYPILEREGKKKKKEKRGKKNRNETMVNFQHETRFYSGLSLFFCLVHLLENDRSFFLSSQNAERTTRENT